MKKHIAWTIGMVLIAIAALIPGQEVRAVPAAVVCEVTVWCTHVFQCHDIPDAVHCVRCSSQFPVLPGVCQQP